MLIQFFVIFQILAFLVIDFLIFSRLKSFLLFINNHYDYKKNSFTAEEIYDKEVRLRDMLKPNTWNELKTMVTDAGFSNMQIFWRNHQFVGVIAVK